MRISQIAGVIATFSIGSNAFLLPPTLSKDGASALSSQPVGTSSSRSAGLQCTGCDVATLDSAGNVDEAKLTNTIPSTLLFRIYVDEVQNGPDRLMVNNVQIYPVEPQAEGPGSVLKADQVVFNKAADEPAILVSHRGSAPLGFMFSTESLQKDDSLNLVKIHFEVVQVRNKDVTLPAFNIQLVETPTGKLTVAMANLADVATPKEGHCNSALCRFKALIANKLSKLKGCMGKPKHSDPRPNIQVGDAHNAHGAHVRPNAHPRPSMHGPGAHGRPHHHGHGHHRHGGFARFMRSVVFHILIPILLGVAMGIAASLVGMMVGHLAIFLWRALFRRNQHSEYQKVEQTEAAEGKGDSEALLAPPVYEEAPAYEDAVDEKQ